MSSIGSVGGHRPPPPGKPPSFDKLDSDSNGALSLDEFTSAAPKGADSAKLEARFKSIDSNGDGSVTKDELDAAKAKSDAAKASSDKAEQQLQAFLFSLQSGSSTKASETGDDKKDIFAQLDANSDGSIAKDEFLKALSPDQKASSDLLSKLFDAIDSDKNGSITQDETKAFQAAHEKRGPPPPPPQPSTASLGALQAYGSTSQLGATNSAGTAYSQAA
jgi:Ca2+-binding EF-hand superfamily protein